MIQSVIFFTFLLVNCGAAPAGPERIGLSLEAIPPELITTANDQIASLRSTAAEKAVAINGLVGTASETIGAGYTAVSDTFNTGLNTVSGAINTGLSAVSDKINTKVNTISDTVGRGFTSVSNGLQSGLKTVGEVFTDQYEAAGSALNQQLEVVGSITSQGSALAQNAVSSLTDTVGNAVNQKSALVGGLVGQARSILPKGNPFADPPRKIEMAVVEVESPLSQVESVKDNIYGFFSGIFQPQPVVDTIKEEEKYGNSGDKFAPIGKALVGTTEGLANFVSNAVNVPFDVFKQITRSASEKLNNLGGRLIGL